MLDTKAATDVPPHMRDLNREQGQTFVIVTHDPHIGELCDRVIRMQDGAIVADVRDAAPPIGISEGNGPIEAAGPKSATSGAVAAGESGQP